MAVTDKARIDSILADALALAINSVSARTVLFFGLGRCVLAIGNLTKFAQTIRAKKSTPGINYREAFQRVRNHLDRYQEEYGYSIPASDNYWYHAAKCAGTYTAEEQEILIKANVPWGTVGTMVDADDNGRDIIAELKSGKLKRVQSNFSMKKARAKRGKIIKAQGKSQEGHTVRLPVYGDRDESIDALVSLLSQWGPSRFVSYYEAAIADARLRTCGKFPALAEARPRMRITG